MIRFPQTDEENKKQLIKNKLWPDPDPDLYPDLESGAAGAAAVKFYEPGCRRRYCSRDRYGSRCGLLPTTGWHLHFVLVMVQVLIAVPLVPVLPMHTGVGA